MPRDRDDDDDDDAKSKEKQDAIVKDAMVDNDNVDVDDVDVVDDDEPRKLISTIKRAKFPAKIFLVLEEAERRGFTDVISWEDGKSVRPVAF